MTNSHDFQFKRAAHTAEIMGGIAGGFLLIIAAVMLVLYRNWKYEQELDSLLWKVNYKDIQIKEQKDESTVVNEAPTKCNSRVNNGVRSMAYLLTFPLAASPTWVHSRLFAVPFPSTQSIQKLSRLLAFRYRVSNGPCKIFIQRNRLRDPEIVLDCCESTAQDSYLASLLYRSHNYLTVRITFRLSI